MSRWNGNFACILFFHDPTMLRALGGKLSKMAAKEEDFIQRCVKIREGEAETNL